MIKQFLIQGAIVDSDSERMTAEDICPSMFADFVKTVEDGDEVQVLVNSVGGSVTSGITIANSIKKLQNNGTKVTAIVEGLAASIASVIVCACDSIKMYESAFLMIHNCWSVVQGNSNDLRKEADIMDKMNLAIMSFYRGKFDLEESEIKILMDNETWFSGSEAKNFCFKCELIEEEREFKIAAKISNFKNIPKALTMNKNEEVIEEEVKTEEEKEETVETEETVECPEETKPEDTAEETVETEETVEEKPEETEEPVEEVKEEDKCEETEEEKKDDIESVIQARVSGMQSKMQNKINVLTKEFQNQLKAKDEELSKVNAELISLKDKLDYTEKELQKSVSAFEEKNNALEKLNSNALTPKENATQVDWHNLKGKEFFDYLRQNKVR